MPFYLIPCPNNHRRTIQAEWPPGMMTCPADGCGEPAYVTGHNQIIGLANHDAAEGETVEVVLFDD